MFSAHRFLNNVVLFNSDLSSSPINNKDILLNKQNVLWHHKVSRIVVRSN